MRFLLVFFTLSFIFLLSGCNSTERAPNSKEYKKLLEADPSNCFYNEQLAITLTMEEKYEKAIQQYEKTLEICPENPHVIFQMGISHLFLNQHEKGFSKMEHAIAIVEESGDKQYADSMKNEMKAWKDNLHKIK